MDISAAIEEYLAAKHNSITHDTYNWYSHYLNAFNKWCVEQNLLDLTQLSLQHVQKFVAASPSKNRHSLHSRAQIVKGFLSWCSQDDFMGVAEKMVRRIEMPKLEQADVKILTNENVTALLRSCDKTRYPFRNKAIVLMLLETGIRASELAVDGSRPEENTGLLMENLILGRGDSYIRVAGKGWKVRTIGLGQEVSMAVRRYLNRERGHSDCPYVFLARGEKWLSVRQLQDLIADLGDRANIRKCHCHLFRHTFAIRQLEAGTSSLVLMQLLGHSTLDSTRIYTRSLTHIQARKASTSVVDKMLRRR
jgi:site-specific recombinase XerD